MPNNICSQELHRWWSEDQGATSPRCPKESMLAPAVVRRGPLVACRQWLFVFSSSKALAESR